MAFTPIIYTYGGGQGLNSLFESLSILFDFSKHSEILWIGRISAVLGVIWISMSGFASRGKDGSPGAIDWTWFLRFAMIWIVLIVPKTTVEIQDKITKATYSVSGAPWSLSIFGWFTSSLGYGMTTMYENVLGGGINTATSYSGNGFAFGSSYYNSLPKVARFEGSNSTSAVFPFIQECLIPAAGTINSTWSGITKQTLLTTPNYLTAIQGLSTNFLQNRYVNVDGVSVTCLTLRDRVLTQWNSDSLILLKQFNLTENQIAPLDNAFIGTATGGSANSLKQAMMMNAIQDAALAGAIQWGDAAMADSLAQAQAQMQQTSAWRQGSQFATVSLVWLHNAAEIITYAIFPFLLFLILLPVGFSVLMEYLKVLFWLQTWPILYAILNFIIGVYATSQSQQMALQYGGFTMSDFYKIGDMNDGIVSTAGYLCTLVPVLTWMFLQRAGMAIASAVGGFTGAINNTAESAGKQEALGSMDINRVSVESSNTAGERTTGLGQHTNRTATGTTMTTGENTSIQSSATANALPVGINFGKSLQDNISNRTQTTHQEASQQAKEWGNISQNLHSDMVANTGGTSTTTGSGGDSSESLKKGQTLSAEAAAQAQALARISGGFELFGNGVKTELQGTASVAAVSKASQDYANAVKKFDDWKTSTTSGTTGSINDGSSSATSLSQRSAKTASEGLSISKDQAIVESTSKSVQADGVNAFKEWMMHDKGMSPEQINDMAYKDVGGLNKLAQEFSPKFVEQVLGENHMTTPTAPDLGKARQDIEKTSKTQQNDAGSGGNSNAADIIAKAKANNTSKSKSGDNNVNAELNKFKDDPTSITGENIKAAQKNIPGVTEVKKMVTAAVENTKVPERTEPVQYSTAKTYAEDDYATIMKVKGEQQQQLAEERKQYPSTATTSQKTTKPSSLAEIIKNHKP